MGNTTSKLLSPMNRPTSFNPLSIHQRVQTKLDQKASKVSVPDVAPHPESHTPIAQTVRPAMSEKHDLQDQFLSLLLSKTEEALHPDQGLPEESINTPQTHGTGANFLQLNKQENTNRKLEKNQEPFQFAIQNSALGELQIQGKWQQGLLHLSIAIPKALDPKERRLLSHLLKVRLSKELNVALEVSID